MNKQRSILFVILPYLIWSKETKNNNTRSVLAFPYGVLSIASYIKTKAIGNPKISILDLNLYCLEEISENINQAIEKNKPDIAAISMMFDSSYKYLNSVSKQIKDNDNNITVVLGGSAATVSWNMILHEQEYVDALCYSEGEYPLCQLIEADNIFETLFSNSAWVTRKSLAEKRAPQPSYVKNLNEVININYELINIKNYCMKEAFSPFSSIRKAVDVRQFFLVTSRGCPFKCVFCSGPSLHGRDIRYADVDVLIGHVQVLVEKYGMNVLTIYDDQILFNRARAKEFFRRLAEFKLRVETPNGLSVAFIDEELAGLMKNAGIDTVPLAIESGSSRMLNEVIHKPLRLEQVKPVVEMLQKNNIFVQAYFVVGLPGEQEDDRIETVRFIKEVGLDWSGFNLATPLRGSELYKICKENGYINQNFGIGDLGMHDYVIVAPGLDPVDVKRKRYLMNLDVNFVNNHRMEIGDYATAILCFEDVIARYEDHAFAYYFLAQSLSALKKEAIQIKQSLDKVKDIVSRDGVWNEYFEHFGINFLAEKVI
jgi:radical SAM superfamily enzyme YgiQ (UPF0313 family)